MVRGIQREDGKAVNVKVFKRTIPEGKNRGCTAYLTVKECELLGIKPGAIVSIEVPK